MHFRREMSILLLVALTGCHGSASSTIESQFSVSGRKRVDLAAAVPGDWDRVCILGPYSGDDVANRTLGFKWPAETLTDIEQDEGISLLVFVKDKSVIGHVEHSRGSGDFSNLTGRCFSRANAKFMQVDHPAKGWPGLFPAGEV